MRVAVISDVHGNAFALEAVLDDIRAEGADGIVNLGDNLAGPIHPRDTAEMLMSIGALGVAGNHDRWMLQPRDTDSVDVFAAGQTGSRQLAWLAALPPTAVFEGELFCCHGTPASDEAPWLDGWWSQRRTTLPSERDVETLASGLDFPVLLCGHTHLARAVRLRDGRQIVNPGSVGLQIVHGSPDARYALLERRTDSWRVNFRIIPYDTRAAADSADANGFPHWRPALTTGWADPEGLF